MGVKSPCIDVCKFDKRTGYCKACARTAKEVRKWKKMADHKRVAMLEDTARRLAEIRQAHK